MASLEMIIKLCHLKKSVSSSETEQNIVAALRMVPEDPMPWSIQMVNVSQSNESNCLSRPIIFKFLSSGVEKKPSILLTFETSFPQWAFFCIFEEHTLNSI